MFAAVFAPKTLLFESFFFCLLLQSCANAVQCGILFMVFAASGDDYGFLAEVGREREGERGEEGF